MRVELCRFAETSSAVIGLFEASPWAEGSWGWFQTLAETTLAPDETAIVASIYDSVGRPCAALPLARDSNGRLRGLAAPYTTRFSPPLGEAATARQFGKEFRPFVANVIQLDALDPFDQVVRAFQQGLSGTTLMVAEYRHFANWYEPVQDFESYWKRRATQLRQTVRRKLQRLEREKRFGFDCLVEFSSIETAIEIYEKVYAASWKSQEPHPAFISALLRSLAREGIVRVGILRIDAEPIAVQIWLVKNGRATIFKLAHKIDAAKHSPGTLLTFLMLQKLIAQDCLSEIDFGRGDDAYKRDWLSSVRTRTGMIGANWRSSQGLSVLVLEVLPTKMASLKHAFFASGRQR
jgi:CelD/BcsL family acetyltransferase involved in cellulose biosynthesis